MGLFGFGSKREDVVDLAERYRQKKDREAVLADETDKKSDSKPLSFFDSSEKASEEDVADPSDSNGADSIEERKKKLAKRILDIVNRIDDLSNKIYHLQQRIEVLERKASIGQP